MGPATWFYTLEKAVCISQGMFSVAVTIVEMESSVQV